jgi:hypothetical protein
MLNRSWKQLSSEQEVLSFEIVIDAKLSSETKATLEELKTPGAGGEPTDAEEADDDINKEGSIEAEEAAERLEQFIKETDAKGMKTLSNFAKNPSGMVEKQMLGALAKAGIYGAIAAAIIALVLSAPELISTIVQALAVKGGPLNQDFHLFLDEQGQLGIDREIQYRYATGLDVIITNYNRGYLLQDPGFVGNNLVDIDTTRSVRLTNNDVAYGYVRSM